MTPTTKAIALIAALAGLPGCAAAGATTAMTDGAANTTASFVPGTTVARLGRTVRVDGPSVGPLALVEDSRCPAHVACIWAGRVRVRVRIITGAQTFEREMTLGRPEPVADGQLTLTVVTPARRGTAPVAATDYRFGFSFAGGF